MNLIFHLGALGDSVLILPLLRRLSGETALVSDWHRAALASKLIEGVRPMDIQMWEFVRLHAEGGPTSVSPAVGELFERAKNIISFISTGEDAWAANVARLAPQARLIFIDPRPDDDFTSHITDWHAQQAEAQGLALGDAVGVPVVSRQGPLVVHPGSGGEEKCWPAQRYEEVIKQLREDGRDVLPLLGEAEAERWAEDVVARWRDSYGAQVFGSLDALVLALSSASAYVGNDAGPTHLAAQMGLPTVALFGPTLPGVWAPVGPDVRVVTPPSPGAMDWLSVEAVLEVCKSV